MPFLVDACRGKRVIHLGFWGSEGYRESAMETGQWLHGRLAAVATEIVGLDVNGEGVEFAKHLGYEAYVVDLMDPDAVNQLTIRGEVVVAGEIIEHLDRQGPFLDAMHSLVEPEGRLILTTPNAYRLSSVLAAAMRREVINPDHVGFHSWYTLTNLVRRHGWQVVWSGTCLRPKSGTLRGRLAFGPERLASKVWPFVAWGLLVVCKQRPP
jgi:SAM-dependent methyltransferase